MYSALRVIYISQKQKFNNPERNSQAMANNNGNIRSSAVWKKYEPKRREKYMDKYKGRFVVILANNRKTLYLSDMIKAKLLSADFVGLVTHGSLIGIYSSNKSEGYKVKYDHGSTPSVNIEGFVKDNPFEPGVYEAHVEMIDAQTVNHYELVVFDTAEHPAKITVEKENE